jgi:hypothetical protein
MWKIDKQKLFHPLFPGANHPETQLFELEKPHAAFCKELSFDQEVRWLPVVILERLKKWIFTNGTRVYGMGWAACIDESKNKRFFGKKQDAFILAEFSKKIEE